MIQLGWANQVCRVVTDIVSEMAKDLDIYE